MTKTCKPRILCSRPRPAFRAASVTGSTMNTIQKRLGHVCLYDVANANVLKSDSLRNCKTTVSLPIRLSEFSTYTGDNLHRHLPIVFDILKTLSDAVVKAEEDIKLLENMLNDTPKNYRLRERLGAPPTVINRKESGLLVKSQDSVIKKARVRRISTVESSSSAAADIKYKNELMHTVSE